ncbi:hypothetical protein ACFC00_04825 [Streptomyces adustus]|uniref:hypothetical protein n=1 Tax=Streptomyces adustus TaxID=1609272 RepID=UPI0035D9C7D7
MDTEDGKQSHLLDPRELAAKTALPEKTVRSLLGGGGAPDDSVNDRVRARIKLLATARLDRTRTRMSDLAAEIHEQVGVSEYWARQVCDGKKVPSVELLHSLVDFFQVDGGEAFFTAPADEALNRVLLPALRRLEGPESDPVLALMEKFGVRSADLRMDGSMTRDQLERVLGGVLRSVLPQKGDPDDEYQGHETPDRRPG